MSVNVFSRKLRSLADDNVCNDGFAGSEIWLADHGCRHEIRELQNCFLYLLAADTVTMGFDKVTCAIDNVDEPVGIYGCKITRA